MTTHDLTDQLLTITPILADPYAFTCDLCNELAACAYGDGYLCKAHYESALDIEAEMILPDSDAGFVMAPVPLCANCGGAHHIQQCGRIRYALFAPMYSDPKCTCGDRGPVVIVEREAVHIHQCRTFGAVVVHFRGKMLQALWNSHVDALNAMHLFVPSYRVRMMREAA